MSRWVFKGYDAKTDAPLTRYGFRVVLDDEELERVGQRVVYDWWLFPRLTKDDSQTKAYIFAEKLSSKWEREYGDLVRVHVEKNGKRLFEVE